MDMLAVTDIFRYAHLLPVAIGLGAAFLADFHALRHIGHKIDDDMMNVLHSCHSLVWKMLGLMWVTGLIMVYIRTGFVLESFSPKLFSKIIVVTILTLNASLISLFLMPLLEDTRGQSLLLLPLGKKLGMAAVGAISTTSWLLALAMGVSKILAASSWMVFLGLMPLAYGASILIALAVMYLVHIGVCMGTSNQVSQPRDVSSRERGNTALVLA